MRIPRPVLHNSIRWNARSADAPRGIPRRGQTGRHETDHYVSTELSFDKRHLPNLLVMNGAVAEIAILPKQFSMIRRDGDVGIVGNFIEQLFHDLIEVFN